MFLSLHSHIAYIECHQHRFANIGLHNNNNKFYDNTYLKYWTVFLEAVAQSNFNTCVVCAIFCLLSTTDHGPVQLRFSNTDSYQMSKGVPQINRWKSRNS